MSRKPALLLQLLNLVLKPISERTSAHATQPVALAQQLLLADREAWCVHWKARGQPWRTEPEIDDIRQEYLAQRRIIPPDIEHGIYPFKDVKLNRADVEWLLATHENGRGPVDWSDENQRMREGVNLRGADLRQLDLRGLPLARLVGGLTEAEGNEARDQPQNVITVHMEQADLRGAHLEGATLNRAHFEGASLGRAHLEAADLTSARLQHARLRWTHLEGAWLKWAHLEDAHLRGANLAGADLTLAYLEGIHLEETIICDGKRVGPKLADVHWEGANLSVVDWLQVEMLGDEFLARQKTHGGKTKNRARRLEEYHAAVRANRQLAIALQAQGLNEVATRFAYRAQVLQRHVFWFQMLQKGVKPRQQAQALGAWLFSWFLYLLAGYGYRLGRSFLAYLLVITLFMTMYLIIDPHLAWSEAFVVSMTAFHGRGFSPSTFTPGDPLSFASAAEAFVGLVIEVTFIATLTQRFFSR